MGLGAAYLAVAMSEMTWGVCHGLGTIIGSPAQSHAMHC